MLIALNASRLISETYIPTVLPFSGVSVKSPDLTLWLVLSGAFFTLIVVMLLVFYKTHTNNRWVMRKGGLYAYMYVLLGQIRSETYNLWLSELIWSCAVLMTGAWFYHWLHNPIWSRFCIQGLRSVWVCSVKLILGQTQDGLLKSMLFWCTIGNTSMCLTPPSTSSHLTLSTVETFRYLENTPTSC